MGSTLRRESFIASLMKAGPTPKGSTACCVSVSTRCSDGGGSIRCRLQEGQPFDQGHEAASTIASSTRAESQCIVGLMIQGFLDHPVFHMTDLRRDQRGLAPRPIFRGPTLWQLCLQWSLCA